jgi:hypothetical protein
VKKRPPLSFQSGPFDHSQKLLSVELSALKGGASSFSIKYLLPLGLLRRSSHDYEGWDGGGLRQLFRHIIGIAPGAGFPSNCMIDK